MAGRWRLISVYPCPFIKIRHDYEAFGSTRAGNFNGRYELRIFVCSSIQIGCESKDYFLQLRSQLTFTALTSRAIVNHVVAEYITIDTKMKFASATTVTPSFAYPILPLRGCSVYWIDSWPFRKRSLASKTSNLLGRTCFFPSNLTPIL